ncbi:NusA-like transcription termination signal-binding factor [archaeon]|nr:MAG: NusA-like transcription termination signal-binding factor [archaeon]
MNMTLTLDTDAIRMMAFFENITGANVKDCIMDGTEICFLIDEGGMSIAIGKNGSSVKYAEKVLKKSVKLFEFSKDLNSFVKNMIPSATDVKIRNDENGTSVEVRVDPRYKASVIGRGKKGMKLYEDLLKRNHQVDELVLR